MQINPSKYYMPSNKGSDLQMKSRDMQIRVDE